MRTLLTLICVITMNYGYSQQVTPAIEGFGAIYEIPQAVEKPDPSIDFKIVLDLKSGPVSPTDINPAINNIARMFNLHAVGGVPKEKLDVVGVLHNLATPAVITNEAYQRKYGMDNPNMELIKALKDSGVKLVVCGQSIIARGFQFEDVNPDIKVSVSALTAFTTYQMRGYNLLAF